MKAVLMSIKPRFCELIASGKKTVEVRKTKPKLEVPFKVYIYCTKDNTFAEKTLRGFDDSGRAIYYKANKGKVIGEFVCDMITFFGNVSTDKWKFGWHITNLVIYDEPRELGEFKPYNRTGDDCKFSHLGFAIPSCQECKECYVQRPPQSWCYVEEVTNE